MSIPSLRYSFLGQNNGSSDISYNPKLDVDREFDNYVTKNEGLWRNTGSVQEQLKNISPQQQLALLKTRTSSAESRNGMVYERVFRKSLSSRRAPETVNVNAIEPFEWIPQPTDESGTVNLALSRIMKCHQAHPLCRPRAWFYFTPTRLIDVAGCRLIEARN